jgi:hypothetical protein
MEICHAELKTASSKLRMLFSVHEDLTPRTERRIVEIELKFVRVNLQLQNSMFFVANT